MIIDDHRAQVKVTAPKKLADLSDTELELCAYAFELGVSEGWANDQNEHGEVYGEDMYDDVYRFDPFIEEWKRRKK